MKDFSTLADFYKGKTVLVTGHTGFKGAWLTHVLLSLGARVVGMSLAPKTPDDIFVATNLADRVEGYILDIREKGGVNAIFSHTKPDVVFHLAAQPLVRDSYDEPLYTMETNIMGTANVLEAVRAAPSVRSVVVITTDKVYENKEWLYGYRENDPLGGHDPYSGSKAAADIVASTYMRAFFNPTAYGETHTTLVGIARAGNVIGGGDWSKDRLVPDIMRAVLRGDGNVTLRNPDSVRPWEHVLEAVSGYMLLGMRLGQGEKEFSGAWNFGPERTSWLSVGEVAKQVVDTIGRGYLTIERDTAKHEAGLLTLDTAKANRLLGWFSKWGSARTLSETVAWYREVEQDRSTARSVTERQVASYFDIHTTI